MAKPANLPDRNYPFNEIRALDPSKSVHLPGHGVCFVCGDDNPKGIGVHYYLNSGFSIAEFTLNVNQQGAPSFAHGGSLAAILDEAMGIAAWQKGLKVMSARIEVDYHKPVPLNEKLWAIGWVERTDGRKIWAEGRIFNDEGQRLTESRCLFIEARKNFNKPQLTT